MCIVGLISDIYPQCTEELSEDSALADNLASYVYREREKASILPNNIKTRNVIIRQGTVFHTGNKLIIDTPRK